MTNRLEQFINDNREGFDADEPSKKVWDGIRERLEPGKKEDAVVVRFSFSHWSVAAAVLLLMGVGLWYFTHPNKNAAIQIAGITKPAKDTGASINQAIPATVDSTATQMATQNKGPENETRKADNGSTLSDDLSDEMYHYAKLIEIKHKELQKIEKDEPLLYRQFAGDVHKLDSVYHFLQKQLPKDSNREQVLEAMIQNLQLQIRLLNHQLAIIKQINQSKKSAYEKAYKSV